MCGLAGHAGVGRALAHYGEEPPISGTRGAGTIFFASCSLRCLYCQNYQISLQGGGQEKSDAELAEIMISLQASGCHNIEPVTPTPHLPALVAALDRARAGGLHLPMVYNCGGYEDPEIIRLLAGVADIYLPDFKYGTPETARALSGAADYPEFAAGSLREMARQVGDGLQIEGGIAVRGLLVRHLVLPGMTGNSIRALDLIKKSVSTQVHLSIMSQYTPIPAMKDHPLLGRRVSRDEYDRVVDHALGLGFDNIYCQDVDERHLAPDFHSADPFAWIHEP